MIQIPENCPCCGSKLTTVNDQLFCVNKDCASKVQKQIEFFAKTLKIKGLGEKTIEKLGLETLSDIYELQKEDYVNMLGEKIGEKLHAEIEESKKADLALVLASFSIPLIGNSASSKICSVVEHISEINGQTCKQAGLGPTATSNLLYWLKHDFHKYVDLPFSFESKEATIASTQECKGVVCITGKLNDFSSRSKAKEYLESLGYKVVDSVTKTTTILVDEEGRSSSKRAKAIALNIPIKTIKDLL